MSDEDSPEAALKAGEEARGDAETRIEEVTLCAAGLQTAQVCVELFYKTVSTAD